MYFSAYCDGTMLAKSGLGITSMVQVRVDIVVGTNCTWHDVGIVPALICKRPGSKRPSSIAQREAKLELFHRFLFLIFKETSAVHLGLNAETFHFIPRLFGFVCYQPQER